jgi:hypothetical protein
VDQAGEKLDGAHRYVLTFPKGELPPVDFFWSITMYDGVTQVPIHNPIERYSIGDRTPGLKRGEDGSLSIYFQHEAPGEGRDSNWLPAPAGPFYVILRTYGPKPPLLSGEYEIPAIRKRD